MSLTSSRPKNRYTTKPRCSLPIATTVARNGAAFTASPIQVRCDRTISGDRWSRRLATRWRDLPRTWDAFYDFFKEVQKKLRAQGERKVYGLGFQMNTTGNDCNALFDYFLIAHGAQDIVTKDGGLHLDDPKVREAVLKTLTYPTTAYKEGFVPPGAINWNDADDNNAFHAKQIVMDLDGSISTEVAVIHNEQDYRDIAT